MGAQPPTPEWGTMLAEAREFILRAWWVVTFPGLAILITVLAINLIGDGLRDALDPKLKTELSMALLEIRKPHRRASHDLGRAVPRGRRRIDLDVDAGEVARDRRRVRLGQIGGDARASWGCLPKTATVTADRLHFDGEDLLALSARQRREMIGKDMAMIFQEPMPSLNPCFTVGFQIGEALKIHIGPGPRRSGATRSIELLRAGRHLGAGAAARRLSAPDSRAA